MSTAKKQYEMQQHYLLADKARKEASKHGKQNNIYVEKEKRKHAKSLLNK